MPPKSKRLYIIPVLSKALRIIDFLNSENRPQSVESLCARTKFARSTVYRILKTLEHHGYLSNTQDGHYRLVSRPRRLKIGFANMSSEHPVAAVVETSLRLAANSAGIELVVLNNRYDAAQTIANAEQLVFQRVQLVIEFQVNERIAPVVADKFWAAGIPLIALGIPHPHAVYFGPDNFRAGFAAGQSLGQYAHDSWRGKVSWVLGLNVGQAGATVQSRITGAFEGIRSILPDIDSTRFVILDDEGRRDKSYECTLEFLRTRPKDRGILIASVSDTSALGAVQAVRELKRKNDVAIVGHDCIDEALTEMHKRGTPLIGSVSHGKQTVGQELIRIGLAILNGESVPPYVYMPHELVTARTR